jgi:hypothetical protein
MRGRLHAGDPLMAAPGPPPAPTPAPPPSSPPAGAPSEFGGWVKSTAALYALIGGAIAAFTGLFAPDRLIPEPLQGLKPFVSLIVVVGLILAWAFREQLKRLLKSFVVVTALLLVLVLALNLVFVKTVTYSRGETTIERHFIVGPTPVRLEDRGISAQDLIKTHGDDREDLSYIWGTGFTVMASAYALCYPLLILGVVLSVAASDLAPAKKQKD